MNLIVTAEQVPARAKARREILKIGRPNEGMGSGVSVLASSHHLGLGGNVNRETWKFPQNVTIDSTVMCVVVITHITTCHGGYYQSHCIMSSVLSLSFTLLLILISLAFY